MMIPNSVLESHFIEHFTPKHQTKLKIQSDSQLISLLNESKDAQEWVNLMHSYNHLLSPRNRESIWINGLEKFSNSSEYMKGIGFFYFCQENYSRALKYFKSAMERSNDLWVQKMAIAAASYLSEYNLVWNYFQEISEKDQNSLEDSFLSQIATAAMKIGYYKQAENLFIWLKKRKNIPNIPSLEKQLTDRFGSDKAIKDWCLMMEEKSKTKLERDSIKLSEWITYSTYLIDSSEATKALNLLEMIKEERLSA